MRSAPLLALLLLIAWPTDAQVETPDRVTLTWENDLLAGRDRHYTYGARISLFGKVTESPCSWYLDGHRAEWGLHVGQEIYTPEDTERRDVIQDDRPYAGWAYVGLSLSRRNRRLLFEDATPSPVHQTGFCKSLGRIWNLALPWRSTEGSRSQETSRSAARCTWPAHLTLRT